MSIGKRDFFSKKLTTKLTNWHIKQSLQHAIWQKQAILAAGNAAGQRNVIILMSLILKTFWNML